MRDLIHDRACLGQKRFPCARQRDASRQPAEQLYLELVLEGADLLAERRLLHPELLRSAGDVAFPRHSQKISQVTQFHIHILNVCSGLDRYRTKYPAGTTTHALTH